MPNWCTTQYKFYVDDVKYNNELQSFHDKVDILTSKHGIDTDFGDNWLGNIVRGYGFDPDNTICRGTIGYLDIYDNIVSIDTETAWSPMPAMWDSIIMKYYPHIKYVFEAEECGCGVYINTDVEGKFFKDRYHIELQGDDKYDEEYFDSDESLNKWVRERFPELREESLSFGFLQKFFDRYNASNDDYDSGEVIIIHEFTDCEAF